MAGKLRWGILGTGNIAKQFVTGLLLSRHGTPAAVGSRVGESAREFSRQCGIGRAHGSYQALIDDPEIDAIYNALPNSLHCQWSVAAMKAGKHVLCEKPLAMNVAETEQMLAASQQTGKLLMEAFMYRCHPLTAAVAETVKSGAIGDLKLIRTSFCYRTRKIDGNVRYVRELGGGGLMDIGCYCIDFARYFAGAEPTTVHAVGTLHESGVDDLVSATMLFPNGVVSNFTCGMSVQADNTAHLCGSEGYIEIPVPWKPPAHAAKYIVTRGIPPRMDNSPLTPVPPPRDMRTVDAGGDIYAVEADDFASAILEGKPLRVRPEDSLANMRILDQMRQQIGVVF